MEKETLKYERKHEFGPVYCVKVYGDEIGVLSASKDRTVEIWNNKGHQSKHTFRFDGFCQSFDISNSHLVVAANNGISMCSLDKDNCKIDKIPKLEGECCEESCWIRDVRFHGRSIIAACRKGTVYAIDME